MMRKMMNVWIVALCLVLASSILVKGECEKESFEGVITAIDEDALEITVAGITVVVTDDTVITKTKKAEKVYITFGDLAEGMTVKVCGTTDILEDVFVADKINVRYGGE